MAGRIRTIKPELLSEHAVATLTDGQYRLFLGLYSLADDDGRFPAAPAYLAGAVFWGAPRSPESVEADLGELHARNLIVRYSANGAQYGAIVGWAEHGSLTYQVINKRSPSRLPAPDGSTPVVLPESSGSPPTRKGREGNGSGTEGNGSDAPRKRGRNEPKAPKVPLDPAWVPREHEHELAKSLGLDLEDQAIRFRNHHTANASRFADWNAAFNNWLRKATDYAPRRGPQPAHVGRYEPSAHDWEAEKAALEGGIS